MASNELELDCAIILYHVHIRSVNGWSGGRHLVGRLKIKVSMESTIYTCVHGIRDMHSHRVGSHHVLNIQKKKYARNSWSLIESDSPKFTRSSHTPPHLTNDKAANESLLCKNIYGTQGVHITDCSLFRLWPRCLFLTSSISSCF
jgi:hypothetical protein